MFDWLPSNVQGSGAYQPGTDPRELQAVQDAPGAVPAEPKILPNAPRPNDVDGSLRPEIDGARLLYDLHGYFPMLFQHPLQLAQWHNDPARDAGPGREAERDFWRQQGVSFVQSAIQFSRVSSASVAQWYNRMTTFSVTVLSGMLASQEAVSHELAVWPQGVSPSVAQATIRYLREWVIAGTSAMDAIQTGNKVLQDQLSYIDRLLGDVLTVNAIIAANYQNEVQTLRAQVAELQRRILELLEENEKLRRQLAEKGNLIDGLLAMIQAGGKGLAIGGVTAAIAYIGLAAAGLFVLAKRKR